MRVRSRSLIRLLAVVASMAATAASGQSLYKYRGNDGEWVFTDRHPSASTASIEIRELSRGTADPRVSVTHRVAGSRIELFAANEYFAPVQVVIGFDRLDGVEAPGPGQSLRFVVGARSESPLIGLDVLAGARAPSIAYRYRYLLGDPDAVHAPERAYRAPFAVARSHRISQAYPHAFTHDTRDSAHAVDISMPVGTDIYAARGGVVIDVASTNYRGGLDTSLDGAEANIVRILHDDGTYAIYAHLNWNGIRVEPGDYVQRGEYIADSGNTGFSTGPHLHFAVLRNADMRLESVPIAFEGLNGRAVVPELGRQLVAY